ncbi:MAG: hypothetical protein A3A86_05400 [Elusimicrobia bacterium RIFCSPLOWO2_01_FULL_60_11]|nr:MAG: hypothetical protein A3A86_05400 [Elusimicrobia bacterium RIFCSPLOWO2_01_FULL_60_11]
MKNRVRGAEQDVTVRAEDQIYLQTQALDAAANGVMITDVKGIILWTNAAFSVLTGYTAEEVKGKHPKMLKSDKQDKAFYEDLWKTILSGRVWHGELVNRRKDGTLYPEEMTITPVKIEGHEITHFIAIKQDVTYRKKMEAMLLQSEKMSAVGRLAGGVAHEINNPLGVIMGFAQILLRRYRDDKDLAMPLMSIEREAQRCKAFVSELLTFSRTANAAMEPCDFNELVRESMHLVGSKAKTMGTELKLELAEGLPPVLVNKNQIQQVIVNLCSNAQDAVGERGTLTVRTLARGKEGKDFIELQVRDNGAGIAPEIKDKIFEPFFTTKEVGKGTGLGLALVYEIVQKHQGTIEAESERGKGTTINIYLPLTKGEKHENA